MPLLSRRSFGRLMGAAGLAAAAARPSRMLAQMNAAPRIVVIGGGFAGATFAKYARRAMPNAAITLVEPAQPYVSCPMSNAVIGGLRPMDDLTVRYDGLRTSYGVTPAPVAATGVDPDRRTVRLANGQDLTYDRLVVAPGIAIDYGAIEGYDEAAATVMPHAWKAGEQTLLLRRQIEAMEDGGTVVITVPAMPYRCPPGPYERASLIASHLKQAKPRSKVLILDANERFPKQALFEEGWAALYPDMIERVPGPSGGAVSRVDPASMTVHAGEQTYSAQVVNVIPPERAGEIAAASGLTDGSGWCPVDPTTFESRQVPGIHVIGDAALAGLPKSASIANTEAKICAEAVAALLDGRAPADPIAVNACYSFVDANYAVSIVAMYGLSDGEYAVLPRGQGTSPLGASPRYRAKEAEDAEGWFKNTLADSFA